MSKNKNDNKKSESWGQDDEALVVHDGSDGFSIELKEEASTEFEALLKDGFEVERFVTMKEGDRIKGYFLGAGPAATVKQNGQSTEIGTWLFKHTKHNFIMRILANRALDQELEMKPIGCLVYVEKGAQENIDGGRRVNRWLVAAKPADRLSGWQNYVRQAAPQAQATA